MMLEALCSFGIKGYGMYRSGDEELIDQLIGKIRSQKDFVWSLPRICYFPKMGKVFFDFPALFFPEIQIIRPEGYLTKRILALPSGAV